jgi:hypothetical protein
MVCGAIPVVRLRELRHMSVPVDRQRARRKGTGKVGMLELIAYGLVGLAAMLVIAFCFAYADELSPVREKSSFDPVKKNAPSSDSRMISTRTGNPRFRGTVRKQQETVPACLLPTTSPAETGTGTIYGDSCRSENGRGEPFHG